MAICYLTIRISNESEEDLFVDFKISATRYIPQYIPKNTMIMDTITDNFIRIFYSFISGNDAGKIKMLYQNQGINFLYKFFPYNTTERHSIIVGGDDYKEIFFKGDEISYETPEECVNGCYAFIGIINPVYKSYTKYSYIINDCPVITNSGGRTELISFYFKDTPLGSIPQNVTAMSIEYELSSSMYDDLITDPRQYDENDSKQLFSIMLYEVLIPDSTWK